MNDTARRSARWLGLLLWGCQAAPPRVDGQAPNVILMMADDLASIDLGCYGGDSIDTPRIDQLAAEGLRLTSYHAGSAVCSPSRMALLSGSYPARLGWRWGVLGYGFPQGTGMSPDVHTIAETFADAGYHTAMAGKWHLGGGPMGPPEQGFASAFYIHMSNNQNRDMHRDGVLVAEDWDNRRLTEAFADEAIRVIEEERDEPFFLYVPWSAPHFPADPHPDWQGRSGKGKPAEYRDVVEELDARVGEILDALERTGQAGNTIVVFTSDNGRQAGQQAGRTDPLHRGRKWQSLEGGTRVPCIVRAPGALDPGETDVLVAAMDLFPTLAAACGVPVSSGAGAQRLDGLDLWPRLTGDADARARHELLYWHGKGAATAIQIDGWKLRFHANDEKPRDPELAGGPELHELDVDPKERNNLAAQEPRRVQTMARRAYELLGDVYGEQVPLGTLHGGAPSDPPLTAGDVYGPWLDAVEGRLPR